jgi:hypothetical protein
MLAWRSRKGGLGCSWVASVHTTSRPAPRQPACDVVHPALACNPLLPRGRRRSSTRARWPRSAHYTHRPTALQAKELLPRPLLLIHGHYQSGRQLLHLPHLGVRGALDTQHVCSCTSHVARGGHFRSARSSAVAVPAAGLCLRPSHSCQQCLAGSAPLHPSSALPWMNGLHRDLHQFSPGYGASCCG